MKAKEIKKINTAKDTLGSHKIALVVFAFLFMATFTFWGTQSFSQSIYTASLENSIYDPSDLINHQQEIIIEKEESTLIDNPVPIKYEFDAKSAISVQIGPDSQEILYTKNTTEKLPIASLTKLMTSLVVLENYDLNTKVQISQEAMNQIGEQGVLKLGETLSVENLLYIALIESSNRAAYAMSEVVGLDNFIAFMNKRAQDLGLLNTHFADSSGLSSDSYSTVEDLVKLSQYLYENQPLFREIVSLKEYDLYLEDGKLHHKLLSTNKLLGEVEGIVGGKTGFTNEARGCFMVIKENTQENKYTINIILGSEDRLSAIKEVLNKSNI